MLETRVRVGFALTRRRIFFLTLTLSILSAEFVGSSSSAPLATRSGRREAKPPPSLPMRMAQAEEEIGSPSELAWRDWLDKGEVDVKSPRRITAKSIFIAPALTACAEGYQADTMNRCVKDVSIDSQAHRGFLVERLNALFANAAKPQASSSHSSSSATGPLQLNIPLVIANAEASNPEAPKPGERPLVIEDSFDETFFLGGEKISENSELMSPTRLEEDKTVSPPSSDDTSGPVNSDDNAGSVVDYGVPTDGLYPASDTSHERNEDVERESQASPTLVLLSSTREPADSKKTDLASAQNSSLAQAIVGIENNRTGNLTDVDVTENISTSATRTREAGDETTTILAPESDFTVTPITEDSTIVDDVYDLVTDSTENYDDENYDDSTEFEDEILKHSEAGIPVTLSSFQDKTSSVKSTTEMSSVALNSSEPSEISSEVSVNRDFVRETTLVDFNPKEEKNSAGGTTPEIEIIHQEADSDSSGSKKLGQPESLLKSNASSNDEISEDPGIQGSLENVERNETLSDKNLEIIENSSGNKNAYLPPAPSKGNSSTIENSEINSNASSIVAPWKPENNSDIQTSGYPEERFEDVYPVRGIEEAFEASISADNSSVDKSSESGETMVAASSNVAGSVVSEGEVKFPPSSEKRDGKPFRFTEEPTKTSAKPFPSPSGETYEDPRRDYPENPREASEEAPPIIRTIEEQERAETSYDLVPTADVEKFFPSFRQRDEGYVRFPSNEARPDNRVRFPSDEANSISNDYKERNHRPYSEETYRAQQSNRANSLTDPSRKGNYWWRSNDWHNVQAEVFSPRSRTISEQRSGSRSPTSLGFWRMLPLIRDPSIARSTPSTSADPKLSHGQSRRANHYRESSQDAGRSFLRNRAAMGG